MSFEPVAARYSHSVETREDSSWIGPFLWLLTT